MLACKTSRRELWDASYKEVVSLPYERSWFKMTHDVMQLPTSEAHMLEDSLGIVNSKIGFYAIVFKKKDTLTVFAHKNARVSDKVIHILNLLIKIRKAKK